MNTVVTSREKILEASRSIASTQGLSALNMRAVAAAGNVSVGSVYNYFPGKSELIIATVEDIWRDIFHTAGSCSSVTRFDECVNWLFSSIQTGASAYPEFLQNHMTAMDGCDRHKARERMEAAFSHIQKNLVQVLLHDLDVRPGVFDDAFSPQNFVEFVLSNVISLLCQPNANIATLISIVQRILY